MDVNRREVGIEADGDYLRNTWAIMGNIMQRHSSLCITGTINNHYLQK